MLTNMLMVQGTTSDAGKSILVAGLGRVLQRRGVRVAPFKPQNMALNSAVTSDGGEIGRAQALQAQACKLEPCTDMNPVLIKPSSDIGAQIIVQGQVQACMEAADFHDFKTTLLPVVVRSAQRLLAAHEFVVVEGAGSPAEINLRDKDIANMGFAESIDCPVIIVADIDKGGVFAHLVGTLQLLSEAEKNRVLGFVINKFRGDVNLLTPGIEWLQQRTAKPVFGVLPYLQGFYLDAEDAIDVQQETNEESPTIRVIVPVLPRISNHTDFDPLRLHPGVNLEFIGPGMSIPAADLIVLPGSKSVRQDRAWLREQGWDEAINKHLRYGGKLLGVCGGYQMLGISIHDPLGIEGEPGEEPGLNFLAMRTELREQKQLRRVQGQIPALGGVAMSAYEIHCGETYLDEALRPFVQIDGAGKRVDGAMSHDGLVIGTYLHGLFDEPDACKSLLAWAGLESDETPDINVIREKQIDRLADTLEQYLRVDDLLQQVGFQ